MIMLTVNEQYILYPLLRFGGPFTLDGLLERLQKLEQSTDDPYLKQDISGLQTKLQDLTDEQLQRLQDDAASGLLTGPAPYRL